MKFLPLCLILLGAPFQLFSQNEPVLATDLLKIAQPGTLQFSPDGAKYVFTVRTIENDRYMTQIWVSESIGSAPRQLTFAKEGASQPFWHPNSQDIGFVRSDGSRAQAFRISLSGGEAQAITKHPNGISNPRFSPDGRSIMYSVSLRFDDILSDSLHRNGPSWDLEIAGRQLGDIPTGTKPNPDGTLAEIRAYLNANTSENNPRVVQRLNFQGETDLNPNLSFSHIHIQDANIDATPRALTSGFFSFSGATFSQDGAYVLFSAALDSSSHPDRVTISSIYGIPVSGGAIQRVASVPGYSLGGPQVSPDGRYILTAAFDRNDLGFGQSRLYMHDQNTGAITDLTATFDRSAGNASWSRDSRYVYFTANSNGGTPLHRIDIRTKRITRLTPFEHGISSYSVSPNSIAMVRTEVANPYEIYTARLDGSQPDRVTDLNHHWVSKKKLSYPQGGTLLQDGFEIQYWIMEPSFRTAGTTYPLLLNIHGGPSAMWGPGEASMWHEFQYFASRGYGVVYSNPRGSGGYGREFQAGNYQDWGVGPAKDVLSAADIATTLPWVDKDRQVITGGSYAGYLTAWIIAHDHRFKAAMAQRGVYELTTFLGEGNAWRLVPNHFGGYPWEPEIDAVLKRNSPQTFVHQIQTPLLIKHGDTDLRTGVIQSELLYKSLKIQGKPVEYIRYPRASHEMSRTGEPKQRIDRMLRMAEFFERYIQL